MAKAIDLSYLTDDEELGYRRAKRAPAAAYGAGLRRAALWAVPIGGLIWVAVTSADGGFKEWAGFVWIAVWVVGLYAMILSTLAWAEAADTSNDAAVRGFLSKIEYHDRVRIGRRPGTTHVAPAYDHDDGPLKSTRQVQHEWYGDHSELNWRDRERAEMYGMDVDTYISNVLDNDKD